MKKTVTVNRLALSKLLEYISDTEKTHYDECEPSEQDGHIYLLIQELQKQTLSLTNEGDSNVK